MEKKQTEEKENTYRKGWLIGKLDQPIAGVGSLKSPADYIQVGKNCVFAWLPVQSYLYEKRLYVKIWILEDENGKIYNTKKTKQKAFGLLVVFDTKKVEINTAAKIRCMPLFKYENEDEYTKKESKPER